MINLRDDIGKVLEDLEQYDKRQIVICTGLVNKSVYDKKNMRMYPIVEEDLQESNIETEVLYEAINEGWKIKLSSFFLKADYRIVKRLANRVNPFRGTIITRNIPYHITVEIRQNMKYIETIQELEVLFAKNNTPWRTPCAPYIYKMFDIYVIDSDLPWYEEIEDICIDFEEYSQYIVKDYIPVWNFEKIELVTDLRAEQVGETLQYKHVINGRRLECGTNYLVCEPQLDFTCQRTERGIEIICDEKAERVWKLYREENETATQLEYELFSNRTQNARLNAVRTIGCITRVIRGLGYEERIRAERVELTDKCLQLKLFFKNKKNDYLQADVLHYLMDEVQRWYPEVRFIVEFL